VSVGNIVGYETKGSKIGNGQCCITNSTLQNASTSDSCTGIVNPLEKLVTEFRN
jgi:hypothetical protein